MKEFRFIGSEATLGDNRLERLGQRFSATEADIYARGGIPALESFEFDKIISPATIAALEFPGQRVTSPPELLEAEGLAAAPSAPMTELRAAWAALATRRAEYQEVSRG